jgi:hypothetical protein
MHWHRHQTGDNCIDRLAGNFPLPARSATGEPFPSGSLSNTGRTFLVATPFLHVFSASCGSRSFSLGSGSDRLLNLLGRAIRLGHLNAALAAGGIILGPPAALLRRAR